MRKKLLKSLRFGTLAVMLAAASVAQADFPAIDQPLGYGAEQLDIPQSQRVNSLALRSVQLLGEALSAETDAIRRAELVSDLGRSELSEALPYILGAFVDASPEVRASAANAAGALKLADATGSLLKLLDDSEAIVRVAAAGALGKIASADEIGPAIAKLLGDSDASVVVAALNAAHGAPAGNAVAERYDALPAGAKPAALRALGRSGQVSHSARIVSQLGDNVVLTVAGIEAIAQLADGSQANAIIALLDAPHPSVRRAALLALPALVDAADVRRHAGRRLEDTDVAVLTSAARLVQPLDQADRVPVLVSLLDHPNAPLHGALREALASTADGPVREAVIQAGAKLIDHADPRRKEDGSFILGSYASSVVYDKHLAVLSIASADGDLLAMVAWSMGRIGDPRAAEPLMTLANRGIDAVGQMMSRAPAMGPPGAPAPAENGEQAEAAAPAEAPKIDPSFTALDEALVALGQLNHAPATAPALRVLAMSAERSPSEPRPPAAYVLGAVGTDEHVSALTRVLADMFEGPRSKFEAVKAIGNLKPAADSSATQAVASMMQSTHDVSVWWMSQWALQRIGATVPDAPAPVSRYAPSVSIVDLTRR